MSNFTTKKQPSFTTASTVRITTPTLSTFDTTKMTSSSVPRGGTALYYSLYIYVNNFWNNHARVI